MVGEVRGRQFPGDGGGVGMFQSKEALQGYYLLGDGGDLFHKSWLIVGFGGWGRFFSFFSFMIGFMICCMMSARCGNSPMSVSSASLMSESWMTSGALSVGLLVSLVSWKWSEGLLGGVERPGAVYSSGLSR